MLKDPYKIDSLVCPCCITRRKESKLKNLIKLSRQYNFDISNDLFVNHGSYYLDWACDNCLKDKAALFGIPSKQNWGGYGRPFFAYYDKEKVCETCKKSFVFRKEEQKFWYEDLKFIVWSYPKDCVECRRQKRRPNEINTEISTLVRNLDESKIDKLTRLVELYLQIDKIEKAKYYFSKIRKNFKTNTDEIDEIKKIIEEKITAHNSKHKI